MLGLFILKALAHWSYSTSSTFSSGFGSWMYWQCYIINL